MNKYYEIGGNIMNKQFIYECLFITIFRNTFLPGYVLYGLVCYRVLDYFVNNIIFGICKVFGKKRIKNVW